MKLIFKLCLFTIFILLTGCLDSHQDIYINPDGSGKLHLKNSVALDPMSFGGKENIEKSAMKEIISTLYETNGIDAWSDFKYSFNSDSSEINIEATGYFKDVNNLKSKGFVFPIVFNNQGNKITVTMRDDEEKKKSDKKVTDEKKTPKKMTEQEIQDEIKKKKQQFNMMKSMMGMVFANFNIVAEYHLPGTIDNNKGFTKKGPNSFEIGFHGEKFVEMFNKLDKDDNFWRQQVLQGDKGSINDPMENEEFKKKMQKEMFGFEGLPVCELQKPYKPYFDFDKEFKTAQKKWAELKKKYPQEKSSSDMK